ncbi:YggT family protein [Paracoccus sp. PXZ]
MSWLINFQVLNLRQPLIWQVWSGLNRLLEPIYAPVRSILPNTIMSWLINFQVLNLRQPLIWQVWSGLNRLLEPIYAPVRSILPNTGGLDLAPLVVFIIIIILQRALANNAGFFYGF